MGVSTDSVKRGGSAAGAQTAAEAVEGGVASSGSGFAVPDEVSGFPPEHLLCPSCRYGVYGLPQNRCPECGERFAWSQVRSIALTMRGRTFESRWRHDPIKALWQTWCLAAFQPRKLWSVYDRDEATCVWPLLLFLLLQWLLFAQAWPTLAFVVDPLMNRLAEEVAGPGVRAQRFVYGFRPGSGFLTHLGVWYVATFAALQVFFQSKKRYGIRWTHILRVFVHATALASFATAVWFMLEWLVDLSLLVRPTRVSIMLYNRIGQAVFWLGLMMTWAYLWLGWRRHLKIPHGWAVATVALLIGFLVVLVARDLRLL